MAAEHVAQATEKLTKSSECQKLIDHAATYGMTPADILSLVATYGEAALCVLCDVLCKIDSHCVEAAVAAKAAAHETHGKHKKE